MKFIGYPQTSTIIHKLQNQFPVKQNFYFNFVGDNGIGYPKFYENWIKQIKKFNIDKDKTKKIIIFLPSIVEKVFSTNEFKEWFINIIEVINKKKFKEKVIIKPHPMLKKEIIKFVTDNIKNKDNYKLENVNSLSLMRNVSFVITADSSIILDCIYSTSKHQCCT